MTPKLKKIIILILIVVLMFVIYTLTNKSEPQTDDLLTGSVASNTTGLLGTQISQALLRIEQITLDKAIFEDELYKNLQDRNVTIDAEEWGRPNPFAPLGNISSTSTTSTTTTSTTTPATTTTTPATSTTTTTTSTTTPATTPKSTVTSTPLPSSSVTPNTN